MGRARTGIEASSRSFTGPREPDFHPDRDAGPSPGRARYEERKAKGRKMLDLVYIGLTIVVFASLWLLVKGVERFER